MPRHVITMIAVVGAFFGLVWFGVVVLGQSGGREVLAHAARHQRSATGGKLVDPSGITFGWIGVHGFVRAAMHPPVGLLVADEAQGANGDSARDRLLEEAARYLIRPERCYTANMNRADDRLAHRAADRCTSVPFHRAGISPIFGSVSNNSRGGDPVSHCLKPQQAHLTWISVRGGSVA